MITQFFYDNLVNSKTHTETMPDGTVQKARFYEGDPAWVVFFWLSVLIVFSLAFFGLWSFGWWWPLGFIPLLPMVFFGLDFGAFTVLYKIGRDWFVMVPATFVGIRKCTSDYRVFTSGQLLFLEGYTETVFLPLNVEVDGEKKGIEVDVQVPIEHTLQKPRIPGETHLLLPAKFTLQWSYQVDPKKVLTAILKFHKDLSRCSIEVMEGTWQVRRDKCIDYAKKTIDDAVDIYVMTSLDAFWATRPLTADDMAAKLPEFSKELHDFLNEQLEEIGVNVLSVRISEFTGNWVTQRVEASDKKLASEAAIKIADADRAQREGVAIANKTATLVELEAKREIAIKQEEVSDAQKKGAAAAALIALQPELVELDELGTRRNQIAARQFRNMKSEEVTTVVDHIADALHSDLTTLVTLGSTELPANPQITKVLTQLLGWFSEAPSKT